MAIQQCPARCTARKAAAYPRVTQVLQAYWLEHLLLAVHPRLSTSWSWQHGWLALQAGRQPALQVPGRLQSSCCWLLPLPWVTQLLATAAAVQTVAVAAQSCLQQPTPLHPQVNGVRQ